MLIIFDMDGVLVDSEPIHQDVEREMLRALGAPVSDEELAGYVGLAPSAMWAAIRSRHGLEGDVAELLAKEAVAKERAFERAALAPIAGVDRLVRRIAGAGHGLAIASSSSKKLIETVVGKLGLGEYFPERVSAEDVPRGKPHPDIFLRAAELSGVPPRCCVVVEDSANGVRAAVAAGMGCIGFRSPNSGTQDLSEADLVVVDFGPASSERILAFVQAAADGSE